MASQSVTNKLVANIKQASDVSTNFFRGTNVVCIDTSNRRIGIDTKTPTWSIDISGVESYNGVKCHNLDISGKADISYALINFLKAPTISADNVNISFIYINELSGNLIDISEVIFNSISGDFIYSNNLIKGNTIEFFEGIIINDLSINGELKVGTFNFKNDVDFDKIKVAKTFTTDTDSESKFEGKVEFLNNTIPVEYITISGNHINTFSISCDNLHVIQQADFSSINVSAEASFNTINVIGEASFNTISAESINIRGQSLQTLITETAGNNLNFTKEISLNTIYAKKIYIEKVDDETTLTNNYNKFFDEKSDYSNIDKLIIKSELDLSYNSATSLRLPYNIVDIAARKLGHIYYSKDAAGVIDGIQIIKSNAQAQDTNLSLNTVTLKQSSTTSYMLELKSTNFTDYGNFKCVPMRTHTNTDIQNTFINPIDSTNSQFVNIDKIITDIIEINANITVSLTNDDNGKDVDAINYDFYIFGLHNTSNSIISNKKLVSNKNTILVFDNSYNYSSTSLHYIGKKKETNDPTLNINHIVFGISYENVPGKTLSLNLINFNASIKSIT
jgi:hypothetical protein